MNVIFLGTPEFSIEPLRSILNSKHKVLAVISQPDRQLDKKKRLMPTALKAFALQQGLQVLQYDSVSKEGIEDIKKLKPDIMVTAAFGQLLSEEFLSIAPHGVYNVHASLLPKYRGASPIQSAMLDGEKETGVTIMKTELSMDTGDIIVAGAIDIIKGEPFYKLHDNLSFIGADLIVEALDMTESGEVEFYKQDDSLATYTKKVAKGDGLINWCESAEKIECSVSAYNPWPTAYSFYNGDNIKIYGVKTIKISTMSDIIPDTSGKKCGEVLVADEKHGLVVRCGDGIISLTELKAPGKKCLSVSDFLRGYKIAVGSIFENCTTECGDK